MCILHRTECECKHVPQHVLRAGVAFCENQFHSHACSQSIKEIYLKSCRRIFFYPPPTSSRPLMRPWMMWRRKDLPVSEWRRPAEEKRNVVARWAQVEKMSLRMSNECCLSWLKRDCPTTPSSRERETKKICMHVCEVKTKNIKDRPSTANCQSREHIQPRHADRIPCPARSRLSRQPSMRLFLRI